MSTTTIILLVVASGLLVLGAAVISGAETAFTRVNRSRAEALAAAEAEDHPDDADADDRVEELRLLSRRPLTTLASLTLVQLLCQVGAAALAYFVGREVAGQGGGIAGIAICMALLFVAVATSRSRALLTPDTTAVGVVPILRALAPLVISRPALSISPAVPATLPSPIPTWTNSKSSR